MTKFQSQCRLQPVEARPAVEQQDNALSSTPKKRL